MSETKVRRSRTEMIAETTTKLIAAARRSFAQVGYAVTSMDELCAEVGLTRGALYHHFGGKEGLLEAVVKQIDQEMGAKMDAVWYSTDDRWEGFQLSCQTYLSLTLDPEVQRIVLQDAPAVLGQRLRDIDAQASIAYITEELRVLMGQGRISETDPEALAWMLNGAMMDAALWIAASDNREDALKKAQQSLAMILNGIATKH
ncbi:MAG: TetR/AcrR family transcriptional regulator [Chloroflexi bacterium AL-W]|nr:TetR/AcrR family transcriptional regulator [Chloroflexi bacterium AL-N1]NOK64735.1 TetR/AcrR family transcriptional regulator [Chloroflexi bacterium AL-N10]NOK75976.1 TetR/AcrR family transcriptional regulator [Chloroflexi bacterium AL-N5]NOK80265.1 TetR/AcrR family transcriptional regulator [Chloroflexi bacterium AL-W]NOK86778.1 TetR/AcrR family transcriptional regulator [Chloroflexi bacterium AL-N15]